MTLPSATNIQIQPPVPHKHNTLQNDVPCVLYMYTTRILTSNHSKNMLIMFQIKIKMKKFFLSYRFLLSIVRSLIYN